MDAAQDIVRRLRLVVGDAAQVALHEPEFQGREKEYVSDCVQSGWVSSVGKYVDRFESMLAEYTGAKRAVAVVNGTAALHISLKLCDVQPGDEVLCPALSFVATANAISYCQAIPHFVDSERYTLGLDPRKLDGYLRKIVTLRNGVAWNRLSRRRIRAVIPMHTLGHPVDLDPLVEVCERFKIALVEDAAESLGTYYKQRHTGTIGRVGALSFNGNKIITTGGGGAILTNDDALADRAKHLTTTAKRAHRWEYVHDEVGFNYRMPNLNAALGCAQLERLPEMRARKRALALQFASAFAGCNDAKFFIEPQFGESNYWLNALLVPGGKVVRDHVLATSHESGLMTRPVWDLLPDLPMYQGHPQMDLTVARSLQKEVINIPSSARLAASAAERQAA
ncbi:LegC family aminotransferase [Planctomyces sp. SH-PL14]|uniref:LegC family aminotransferase n=1 Tax=Planctomyces sp. SH-PL14 TaxID=1632864 RepID=UPI00078B9145|nr:LegC family aminotransferase [Planctomyces sp. SH-PL14]AMV17671.1 Putative pyridoxal phosphate-dependent aminotransferase EpsN [Planctomyces sp. SH-PL14]